MQAGQEGRQDEAAHQQRGEELVGQLADVGPHDGRGVAAVVGDQYGEAFREFGVQSGRLGVRHEQGGQPQEEQEGADAAVHDPGGTPCRVR